MSRSAPAHRPPSTIHANPSASFPAPSTLTAINSLVQMAREAGEKATNNKRKREAREGTADGESTTSASGEVGRHSLPSFPASSNFDRKALSSLMPLIFKPDKEKSRVHDALHGRQNRLRIQSKTTRRRPFHAPGSPSRGPFGILCEAGRNDD